MVWQYTAAVACPLVLSWLLTAVLIRWAPRLGLVDHPAARKVHTRPTPKGGGLAIYLAFADGVLLVGLLFAAWPTSRLLILVGLGLPVVLLGLIDDLRPLSWKLRLAVQTSVAAAAVFLWPVEASWAVRGLGVFWVVAMLNAMNMLDNMDALSGGVAWIALVFLGLTLLCRADAWGPAHLAVACLLLLPAITGFLWFNRPPARIFMGDAGSTFLGFVLGLCTFDAALNTPAVPGAWAVPLCLLAVPCYDMTSVVLIRLAQGRSPFHADKQHLSHRLVELGLSSPPAVAVIWLLGLGSGASGLALYWTTSWPTVLLVAGQLACWWLALALLEYGVRRKR